MNLTGLIGKKLDQAQRFLEDGSRVPVTVVDVSPNVVSQIKSIDKDGYQAIQLGFGTHNNPKKPILGHMKKAGREKASRFFVEVRVDDVAGFESGREIKAEDVFRPGDIVDVSGRSKGKGYAGVVKRHHFKGGPRTHGQSDRERAPGSIGQTTTPGRVYKGKRMSGRKGDERSTVKNLVVLGLEGNTLIVKGLIPGVKGGFVIVRKTGEEKKFVGLFKKAEAAMKDQEISETKRDVTVEEFKSEEMDEKKVSQEPRSEEVKPEEKKEVLEDGGEKS